MTDLLNFLARLDLSLKKVKGKLVSDKNFKQIDKIIADAFEVAEQEGRKLIFADGIKIVSGTSFVQPHDPNQLRISWKTEFEPKARFNGQQGKVKPLGFYEEYDLYFAKQGPFPPTLIIRFGNEPEDYSTYNTVLQGIEKLKDADLVFTQAFWRARDLGYLTADGKPIIQT